MGFLSDDQASKLGAAAVKNSDNVSTERKTQVAGSAVANNKYTGNMSQQNQRRIAGGAVRAEKSIPTSYKERAATSAVRHADNHAHQEATNKWHGSKPAGRTAGSGSRHTSGSSHQSDGAQESDHAKSSILGGISSGIGGITNKLRGKHDSDGFDDETLHEVTTRAKLDEMGVYAQHGFTRKKKEEIQLVMANKEDVNTVQEDGRLNTLQKAVALYDFEARGSNELAFAKGEDLYISWRTYGRNDWWIGQTTSRPTNARGLIPANYIRLVTR